MAKRKGGTSSFPGWATPMTEPKIHGTDPYISPDNAVAYPKAPNTMGWPIAAKTPGYKIGTGGVRNDGRFYRDGRKGK